MTKQERDHLIEWLVTITGYNRKAFTKMTDEMLDKTYIERMEKL
jgi:hypothetical protein